MAETKAERDGNAPARRMSRVDIVVRGHTHNFVTSNFSRKCVPIALAHGVSAHRPGVRQPAAGMRQRLRVRLDLRTLAESALAVAVSARAEEVRSPMAPAAARRCVITT